MYVEIIFQSVLFYVVFHKHFSIFSLSIFQNYLIKAIGQMVKYIGEENKWGKNRTMMPLVLGLSYFPWSYHRQKPHLLEKNSYWDTQEVSQEPYTILASRLALFIFPASPPGI